MCVSSVYDLHIPFTATLEEATEILNQINNKYRPQTGRKYRIVSREVTPWVEA